MSTPVLRCPNLLQGFRSRCYASYRYVLKVLKVRFLKVRLITTCVTALFTYTFHRSVAEQLLAVCAEERLREHLRLRSSSAWPFRCAPASSASSAIVRYDALSVSAALSPPCLPPLHLSPSAPFTLCTSLTLSPCDAKLCEAPVSDALRYAHARYSPHDAGKATPELLLHPRPPRRRRCLRRPHDAASIGAQAARSR